MDQPHLSVPEDMLDAALEAFWRGSTAEMDLLLSGQDQEFSAAPILTRLRQAIDAQNAAYEHRLITWLDERIAK